MRVEKPELVNELAVVLSDAVVLSYKLQGAHWNVLGPDFHEYHAFFEMIYEDIESSIDPLAENIRKMGAPAPSGLGDFISLTGLNVTPDTDFSPSALCSSIHDAIERAIANVNVAFQVADSLNEQGIADFLAGRDDMLKKWRWQLAASLHQGYEEVSDD